MIQNEVLALNFIAFIVMPVVVETTICLNPSPEHRGEVCNWEEKIWIKKFDMETKQYYYILEEKSDTDNFFERKARKRYWKRKENNEKNNICEDVSKTKHLQRQVRKKVIDR